MSACEGSKELICTRGLLWSFVEGCGPWSADSATNTTISFHQQIQRFLSLPINKYNDLFPSSLEISIHLECLLFAGDTVQTADFLGQDTNGIEVRHPIDKRTELPILLTENRFRAGRWIRERVTRITMDLSGRMRWINLSSISAQKHTDRNNNPSNLHAASEFRWEGKNSWQIRAIPDEISHHK